MNTPTIGTETETPHSLGELRRLLTKARNEAWHLALYVHCEGGQSYTSQNIVELMDSALSLVGPSGLGSSGAERNCRAESQFGNVETLFEPFPKTARLFRECIITEKIDGTNGQVIITEDGRVLAGSRSRLITPQMDNFGFAKWVQENAEELLKLGPGRHFGEWWGAGIGRRYGLTEKRFSLFNVERWGDATVRPTCCHVVPILHQGLFDTAAVRAALDTLRFSGSAAAPGFMKPEGVIVWHTAARCGFKTTLDKDDEWKNALSPSSSEASPTERSRP